MIEKRKIDYIINEFKLEKASKREQITSETKKFWVASERKKSLIEYISNLETEELFDLVGLMLYGRELVHYNMNVDHVLSFSSLRNDYKINNKDTKPSYIANYLLGKEPLDQYLSAAVSIINLE